MKESLKPGIKYEHKFKVPLSKTVPALYPESEEFIAMPEVFATGFLVGFLEWACIKAINPHLGWPKEQTVGTHIDVSHEAATPPGLEVTATVELIAVEGKKLIFTVEAHDGVDLISKGRHERFVINKEKFDARVGAKAAQPPELRRYAVHWAMERLGIALAEYIAILESSAVATHRAEDRGRYQRHLAQSALMYAALKKHSSIANLKELVASERRNYGWDFLDGPEGSVAEAAFNEFAKLVESAT